MLPECTKLEVRKKSKISFRNTEQKKSYREGSFFKSVY